MYTPTIHLIHLILPPHGVHQVEGRAGVQARGRLVEEEEVG